MRGYLEDKYYKRVEKAIVEIHYWFRGEGVTRKPTHEELVVKMQQLILKRGILVALLPESYADPRGYFRDFNGVMEEAMNDPSFIKELKYEHPNFDAELREVLLASLSFFDNPETYIRRFKTLGFDFHYLSQVLPRARYLSFFTDPVKPPKRVDINKTQYNIEWGF
jgi:hypothetical protein